MAMESASNEVNGRETCREIMTTKEEWVETTAVEATEVKEDLDKEMDEFVSKLPTRGDGAPVAIVIVGMAGSGKTTFTTALYHYLTAILKHSVYSVNLDPAVDGVPFPANIDIRDTVSIKNVMNQYSLGPNGGILTALNLYATRFDQVLSLIEKRRGTVDYVLIDTPGQIEVFNWSASGNIILDSLALTMPTTIAFLIDSFRCQKPTTLMANLMYACSVMYKSKLPFIGVFTKADLADPAKQIALLKDPSQFALEADQEDTYASSLSKSMAWTMSEFYENLPTASVAVQGDIGKVKGFDEFLSTLDSLSDEYFDVYLHWVLQERHRIQQKKIDLANKQLTKFNRAVDEDGDDLSDNDD